ncbi:MAG: endoflagellar protein [Candidatus Omnitrophota bacterium]|nr:MAG: endoflagellar protein [Candidatus Omnitrophota bacterium]
MIKVTLFDNQEMFINADLIESVKSTPDTVISLTINKTIMVKETVEEIVREFIVYKQLMHNPGLLNPDLGQG